MRRTISFLLGSGLLLAGIALAAFEFLQAPVMRGFVLLGAGLLIATGGTWLIEDFVLPFWRRRNG